MLDKIKALWARLQVRWHVIVLALLAALPGILDWLAVIDLKPILEHFVSPGFAGFITGCMPFVLMFVKSAVSLEPEEPK
jgi:hypothetical protein